MRCFWTVARILVESKVFDLMLNLNETHTHQSLPWGSINDKIAWRDASLIV